MTSAFHTSILSESSPDRGDMFTLRHPDRELDIKLEEMPIFWFERVPSTMDTVELPKYNDFSHRIIELRLKV